MIQASVLSILVLIAGAALATAFAFATSLLMILPTSQPEIKVVERAPNDSMAMDALVVTEDVHATVPTAIRVYLVERGGDMRQGSLALLADHVEGLELFWGSDRKLNIVADGARVFRYYSNVAIGDLSISVDLMVGGKRVAPVGAHQYGR